MVSEARKTEWRHRVDYLLENATALTTWEVEFVDSLEKWLGDGKELTFPQSRKLGEIFKAVEEEVG